ncbi:hypothetical protein AB3N59_01965 [Leptospira sp. WS92.C1]
MMKQTKNTFRGKSLSKSLQSQFLIIVLFIIVTLAGTYYIIPESAFASDSLVKVLQAKGWVQSDLQSQEVHYLGKQIDPDFNFFLVRTIPSSKGERIAPFPFANTVAIAPFIRLDHPELILYLSALLFCFYTILLYKITKRYSVSIVAVIGTPLFHHFISFSDVAIAAVFVLGSVFLLSKKESLFSSGNQGRDILAGVLLGAGCWYRPEILILAISFLLTAIAIRTIRTGKTDFQELSTLSFFAIGFLILFGAFIFYNFIMYDSLLGPRIVSNQSILNFDPSTKIISTKGLLIGGNGRMGFFGYSPWYLLILFFCVLKWSQLKENSKIWIVTFGINLLFVCILTPNDSNIDWGSRYFTCSVFIPLILLMELHPVKIEKKLYQNLVFAGAVIGILYSLNVSQKVIKTMRKISVQLAQIQSEIPWDSSKIFITQKNNIANTFGLRYISQTILLIPNKEVLSQILDKDEKRTIVLIEDMFDRSLSDYAKKHIEKRNFIREIRNTKTGLLSLTEIVPVFKNK